MICKFNDICEKDMDMLFLEEIVSSKEFASIFLSKINIANADIIKVEHSKMDTDGESDITVICSVDNKLVALLIEDKIDAAAMPKQCERYFKRGNRAKANQEYNEFYVFIVAPEKYLKENEEAKKYPNKVTYEECADYFQNNSNKRNQFKFQQIQQAIEKQKHGYQQIEDVNVTDYWNKYISHYESNYIKPSIKSKKSVKPTNSRWVMFNSAIDKVSIIHKSERGFVDLEFNAMGNRVLFLEEMINENVSSLSANKMTVEKTGKSAVVRIKVPVLDFTKPFENSVDDVNKCFVEIEKLYAFSKNISKKMIVLNNIIKE